MAAVVSAGVAGAGWDEAAALGLQAATAGGRLGSYVPGADVARRIRWALDLVRDADDDTLLDLVDGLVGTGVATQEAVPAAFAIASRAATDPWRAGLLGARLGGDSDTIAAMAAAMVGACTGLAALPATAVQQVRRVNGLDLEPLVDDLLRIRAVAMTRLVGLASAVVDLVLHVDHLPEPGGDVLASASRTAVGGGLTALRAAAADGLAAVYAGGHGTGPFGDLVRAALADLGVLAALPPTPDQDSGFCVVLVDRTGERTFATTVGAEGHLTARQLDGLRLRPGDAVYVSGYDLAYPHGPVLGGRGHPPAGRAPPCSSIPGHWSARSRGRCWPRCSLGPPG